MTRAEHLLTILAEECVETAQRATKALRFGIDEVQDGQDLTNAERLIGEFCDISAAIEMLEEAGLFHIDPIKARAAVEKKKAQVEHYFGRSRQHGTLTA